jgi:hypothetical protein
LVHFELLPEERSAPARAAPPQQPEAACFASEPVAELAAAPRVAWAGPRPPLRLVSLGLPEEQLPAPRAPAEP